MDRLIATARAEPDLTRQAALYRQIQGILLADLPYIPLWYEDQFFAARRGLQGYRLAPDGNYDALARVSWTDPDRDPDFEAEADADPKAKAKAEAETEATAARKSAAPPGVGLSSRSAIPTVAQSMNSMEN